MSEYQLVEQGQLDGFCVKCALRVLGEFDLFTAAGLLPLCVRVIDADGREIAWNEVSPLNNAQMRVLMREIVDRLYTFHVSINDPDFLARVDRWAKIADRWDEPDDDIEFFRKLAEDGQQ